MLQLTTLLRTIITPKLPKIVSIPVRLMPYKLQKLLATQLLAYIFQEAIETGDMDFLIGKRLKFEITDCNLQWTYTFNGHSLQLVDNTITDASIRFNLREFILLTNQRIDPDTLFFQRRLIIEGNTELGLTMKNLMDTLDPEKLPHPLIKGLQFLEYFLEPK